MPKISNLASQALAEIGDTATARDDYEMRNNVVRGADPEASLPDGFDSEAYEHKPLSRGSAHTGGKNGGVGTRGKFAARAPKLKK